MADFKFYKYHGTGNDFILIDNRLGGFPSENQALIAAWCERRYGVGADGLILLENDPTLDFKMVYFNADGSESTMCGNGGRCLVAFARDLGLINEHCEFMAIDGLHEAEISKNSVSLKMRDVQEIKRYNQAYVLDTGSPHYIEYVEDLIHYPVFEKGRSVRNTEPFKAEGINVNFVEILDSKKLFVRTYERGVEDETFSCGTGATAAALSYLQDHNLSQVQVQVKGGQLSIRAEKNGTEFSNIWLQGPAIKVFEGTISNAIN